MLSRRAREDEARAADRVRAVERQVAESEASLRDAVAIARARDELEVCFGTYFFHSLHLPVD